MKLRYTIPLLLLSRLTAQAPSPFAAYSSGTDNAYYQAPIAAITSPSLYMYPKTPGGFVGGSNNCGISAFTAAPGLSFTTPTDSASETWTQAANRTASTAGLKLAAYYVLGDTAGATKITEAYTGSSTESSPPMTSAGGWLLEIANCSTSSIGGTGTLDTTATGSPLTLTLSSAPSSGDIVVLFAIDATVATTSSSASPTTYETITPGTNFTSRLNSRTFAKFVETSVSTTSTSVTFTPSGSHEWIAVAFVIKHGSTGTVPTVPFIDTWQEEQFPTGTSTALAFPFLGNTVAVEQTTGTQYISSITGSTCTWSTGVKDTTGGNTSAQIAYGTSCTPSSTATVTPTFNTSVTNPGNSVTLASMSNVSVVDTGATTGLGACSAASGLISCSGTSGSTAAIDLVGIAPSLTNDVVLVVGSIDQHTAQTISTDGNGHTPQAGYAIDTKADDAQDTCDGSTPPSTLSEDNPFAVYYNTDLLPETFIFGGTWVTAGGLGNCLNQPTGTGSWTAVGVAFRQAQPWSNVLSSSRAINWGTAGLPATLPDGETTPNPWTPPTRPACTTGQAGTTVPIPSGASVTTINSAMVSCAAANPNGSYLLLGGSVGSPATFTVASTQLRLVDDASGNSHNAVTLRGGGAMATKIVVTGTGVIVFGNAWTSGSAPWTAGFSQGATSITVGTPTSGTIPVAGNLVLLEMCNTGFSGAGCSTGSVADNGNVFLCGGSTFCANQAGNDTLQGQMVRITSITGTGPYTVNFSPGLYMQNWSSTGGGATMNWIGAGSIHSPYGIGLEDLTVDETGIWNTENFGIQFNYVYASWMKGVRVVGSGEADSVEFEDCKNSLIFNSMFDDYSYNRGDLSLSVQETNDSDNLILNTQMLHGLSWEGHGPNEGDILAYNFIGQTHTLYYEANPFQHTPGTAFTLYEGNETGHITDDDTWGTANLNTFFRNYMSGWDPPYYLSSQCASLSCVAMKVDGGHRFANVIGNAIGSAFLTNYQATLSTPTNGITNNAVYRWSADMNDPLVLLTVMRWGNVSSVTQSSDTPTNSGIRFVSSEVPSSINVNAQCTASTTPYSCCTGSGTGTCSASTWTNSVPSNNNLPCSFFLAGYAGTSCTPTYTGGTGLSWWKVCTTWTTFPSSCASTVTQPFPVAGPDIVSGPYVSGTAYDIPAYKAFISLPIDSAYQNSYPITGSSWSGTCASQPSGTYACETLTVTGLPSGSAHIMGGFQITGVAGCNSAAGAEFVMTASSLSGTTGTIVYPLASNPGSCSGGTMLFPDVREFDENVYESDSGTVIPPGSPLNLLGTVSP